MKRFLLPIVTLVGMCLVTGCDGALPSGGVSTRDKITQREITREEAKIVSADIKSKQQAEFGASSSSGGLLFAAPKPAAKRANDGSSSGSNYSGWEYGSDYDWGNYDGANYQDNWSYQKQQGEDQWGYKEGQDYNTWYQGRAAQKKVQLPDVATFEIYVKSNYIDISRGQQEIGEVKMTFEYDFNNYYMHVGMNTTVQNSNGSQNSSSNDDIFGNVNIYIYYKDGSFNIVSDIYGETNRVTYPVGRDGASAYFTTQKKQFNSFVGQVITGSSYLMYVDMFKEAGFDCKYGSNDAGNLEMIIKGKDVTDMVNLGIDDMTVSLDASFVWDQYYLRCMEMHMAAASTSTIEEAHAKLVFKDGCTPTYPANA